MSQPNKIHREREIAGERKGGKLNWPSQGLWVDRDHRHWRQQQQAPGQKCRVLTVLAQFHTRNPVSLSIPPSLSSTPQIYGASFLAVIGLCGCLWTLWVFIWEQRKGLNFFLRPLIATEGRQQRVFVFVHCFLPTGKRLHWPFEFYYTFSSPKE